MSKIYDNWGKLVEAVVKRERCRDLCYCESLSSSFSSVSSDFPASTSSRRLSFDLSSAEQFIGQSTPEDGNSQPFAATSSADSHFDPRPQSPKIPSFGRFGKIFGAARRFVAPVRKHLDTEIQSGYSAPTELEVKREIPAIGAYALSFDELKKKTYNFTPKAMIAEGFYGAVYFAWLKRGRGVALKMRYTSSKSESNDKFLAEVSMVSKFKHENLVEFLGYSIESNCRILAYEFAKLGTLYDFLHGREGVTGPKPGPVLDWMQRVRIAVDAARGLEYLHENAVDHRYIRSSNVLLFNDFKAKIADTKLCTIDFDDDVHPDSLYNGRCQKPLGSPSPVTQFLQEEKDDVYDFGVVLFELLTGKKPRDDSLPYGQQNNLVPWAMPNWSEDKVHRCVDPKLKGEYPQKAASKFAATAALCVQYEAGHRPYMRSVVKALEPLLEAPAPGT